jgi:hypothetical protein
MDAHRDNSTENRPPTSPRSPSTLRQVIIHVSGFVQLIALLYGASVALGVLPNPLYPSERWLMPIPIASGIVGGILYFRWAWSLPSEKVARRSESSD